ncbi:MAG: hypothetical protein A2Y66_04455 [Nitrospirae bacterium RBG_13_41_22]|nr:MAG: hypothetical protein A2Y66_04455 [Nitrospirae bacterium RBG_13_41_22]
MNKENYEVGRRIYKKPKVEQVQLVPEEAVLTSCKAPSFGVGPTKRNCKGQAGADCFAQTS